MKLLLVVATLVFGAMSLLGGESLRPLAPFWQPHWPKPLPFDTPPKLVRGHAPMYPITELIDQRRGDAVIDFTIDEKGTTRDFKVVSASRPHFATSAIEAVQRWKFEPALKHGHPVAIRHVQAPFHYKPFGDQGT